MSHKIIGATVGTTLGLHKISEKLKPVKTINHKVPDENGNIDILITEEISDEKIIEVVNAYFDENPIEGRVDFATDDEVNDMLDDVFG